MRLNCEACIIFIEPIFDTIAIQLPIFATPCIILDLDNTRSSSQTNGTNTMLEYARIHQRPVPAEVQTTHDHPRIFIAHKKDKEQN